MPGDDCMCGGLAPVGGNCEDRHASKEGRNMARCRARELINRTTAALFIELELWQEGKGEGASC